MSLEEFEEGQYLTPEDEGQSDKPSENYILNSRPYHQHGRGRSFHQGYWRGRSFWGRGKPFRGNFQANTRKIRKSFENGHEQENRSPISSLERSRDSKERSKDSKERSKDSNEKSRDSKEWSYSRSCRPSREKSPTSSRRSKSRGRSNRTNSRERSHRTLSHERSQHGHRTQDKFRSRSRDRIRSRSPRRNSRGRTQKGYNREETRQLNNSRDNSEHHKESHHKNNSEHHKESHHKNNSEHHKESHHKNNSEHHKESHHNRNHHGIKRDHSKNSRDRHKSDEPLKDQFEKKRRSAELRENGLPIESECKYSPNMNDKLMNMSNDWSSKKRHNSSPLENELIKEENDRRDNKRRNLIWSQRELGREHNHVQDFVEEGLREIRFGEKGRPIKKEHNGVNKRKELRNRNRMENYVLTSVDIECLHRKNDRYHFYRVPNKSMDTTSSSTTSNDTAMLDNSYRNTKTETSDDTAVFDNSFKNTKSRTSHVINIAKGISKVCQGRITADGKRTFTDIKEEELYNDNKDGKTINQTNEVKRNVQHSEIDHNNKVTGGKSFNFRTRQNSGPNENKYESSTNQFEAFTNQPQRVLETNQPFCHDQILNRESNYKHSNDFHMMHCNNVDTTMHCDVQTDKSRRYAQPDEAGDNVPYFTNISRSRTLVNKLNSRQPLLRTPARGDNFVHDYHCSSSNQHNLSETPARGDSFVHDYHCSSSNQHNFSETPQICHNPPDQVHPNIPDKEKIDSVIDWFMRNNSNRSNSSKESPEDDVSVNAAEKSDINTSQSHTSKTDIIDKSYNAESSLQDTSGIASPSTSLKYQEVQSDGHHIYTPFANFYEQSENKEERDQSKKSEAKLNLKITVKSKSSSGDSNNNVQRVRDRKSKNVTENKDAKSDNLTGNKNNKSSNVTENTEKPNDENSQNSDPSEITCSRTTGISKTTSCSVTKSKSMEGKEEMFISGEHKKTSQSSKSSKEKKHSSDLNVKTKDQKSKDNKREKKSCEKMMKQTETKKSLVLNPNINNRNVPTSPKINSFAKDKLTSTPVTIGKTMSCEKDLFLSPVLNLKTSSGSKEKKRHTSGSHESPNKCRVMSEALSESDCSANSLMVVDSWHEGTSSEKSKHSSGLLSKDVSVDKEMVDIEEEADSNQNIFDKIVHKKKSEKRSRSPLRLSEIKKINSDKKALKAKHGNSQSVDKDQETKILTEKSNNLKNEKKALKKEHKRRKEEMHQKSKPSSSDDKSKVVLSCEKLNEASLLKKTDVNSTPTRLKVKSTHEKSKTIDKSETCDNSKMTSSFDTSDITTPPVHSLFGRKIRTGLEDLPFINTPKKDKPCEGKSNESEKSSINIPENLFHKMKKKLSQTSNVKRLDPAKTKIVKLGTSIKNEETTVQTDKEKQKQTEGCKRQQQTNIEEDKEMKNQKDKTVNDLNKNIHRSAKTHGGKDNSKSIENKSLKQHKQKQGEKIRKNSHDKSKCSSTCGMKEGDKQSVEKEHHTRKEKTQNDNTKIKLTNIDNCKNKLTGSKDETDEGSANILMSVEMCKVGNKHQNLHKETDPTMIKENNHNDTDCNVDSFEENNVENQQDENTCTMECSDENYADDCMAETTVSTEESFECFGIIENVDLNTVSLSADELEKLENVQNVEVSLESSLTTSKIEEVDNDEISRNMSRSSLGAEEKDEDELLRDMEVNCLDVSEEVIVQTSFEEENSENTEGSCQLKEAGDVCSEDNYTGNMCQTGVESQETDQASGTSDKMLTSSSIVEEVEVCTTEELLPCHYEQLEVVTEKAAETAQHLNVKNYGSLVENANIADISLRQITTRDKSPNQINTSESNVNLETLEKNSNLIIGGKTKESIQESASVDIVKLSDANTISEMNSVSVDKPQSIASKSIIILKSTKNSDGTFEKMENNSKKQKLLEMLNPERIIEMKVDKSLNLSLTSKHCDSIMSDKMDKDSSNHSISTSISDQKLQTVHKSERKTQNVNESSNKSEHVTKEREKLTKPLKVVKSVPMKSPVKPMNKSLGSGFVRHNLPPKVPDNRGKTAKANILKDWKMSDKVMPLKQSEKNKKLPSENKYKSSGVSSVGKVKTQNNSPSSKQKISLWKDLRKFEGKTIKRKKTNTSLPKPKTSVCTESKVSKKTDKPIANNGEDITLSSGTATNNQGITLGTDTNINNDKSGLVCNNKNDGANAENAKNAEKVVEDNCGEGDICGLKIISVCGNVNFDEPEVNSSEDEEELLEYVKNMNERPVTPSLDNIDMIMNSSPLRKYDKTTKKDGEKTNDQSKLVVVTMPSLVHKGTRKDSLSASFVPMETNNSTTDESELDSSCDKLVIDTEQSDSKLSGGSSVEAEQTNISLSNDKENSEGTTETVVLLKELSTVEPTTESMHNTEPGNDMSESMHNTKSGNDISEIVHNVESGNKMLEDVHNAKFGNERSESVLNTEPGNDMSKRIHNAESGNDMSEIVHKAESRNDMSESVQIEENCKAPSTTKDSSSLSDEGSKCIDNDETLIYAHNTSDMESSKETIDYSQDHQNKGESENFEHDLEEYSDRDFDEDDDDIQIMWYIKGVPQSPWTPATPHIKEEGTNEGEEEDDEFKQPPVLPELDEYFKKNPEIFSQTKTGNDTSGNSSIVPSSQPDSPQLDDTYCDMFFVNDNPDFKYEATPITEETESNDKGIKDSEGGSEKVVSSAEEKSNHMDRLTNLRFDKYPEQIQAFKNKVKKVISDNQDSSAVDSEQTSKEIINETVVENLNSTEVSHTKEQPTAKENDGATLDLPQSTENNEVNSEQDRPSSAENMYDSIKHHSRQRKPTKPGSGKNQKQHVVGSLLFPPALQRTNCNENDDVQVMQQSQQSTFEMAEPTRRLIYSMLLFSRRLTNNGNYEFSHFKPICFTHIKILLDGTSRNTIGEFIPKKLCDVLLRCVKCLTCKGDYSPYRFMRHVCSVQWKNVSDRSLQNQPIPREQLQGSSQVLWKLMFYVFQMEKHLRSLYCGENTSQQDDKASKLAKKHWKEIHSNQNTQHNVHPVQIVVNQNQYTAGQYQAGQQVCQQSGNKDRQYQPAQQVSSCQQLANTDKQYQPAQQVCQQLGNKDRQYQPAQQMPVSQQSNNTAGHYPYPVAPQLPTYQKSVNNARQYQNHTTHPIPTGQHLGNLPAYQQQNTHQGGAMANPLSNIHPSSNRGIIPHNIQDNNQRPPHHTTTYVVSSNPYHPTFQPTSQNEITDQPAYPQVNPASYANQPMFQPTGQSSQIGTSQSIFQPSRQPSQVVGNYQTFQTGSPPINRTNMPVPTMQQSVQTPQPIVNSQMNYLYNSNAAYERHTDNLAGENRSTLPRQESRVNKTFPLLRQMVSSDMSSCSVSNLPQQKDGNTNQQSVYSDANQSMTRSPSQKKRSSSNIENSSPSLVNGVSNRSISLDSIRNKTPPSCRTTPDLPGINGQNSSLSAKRRKLSDCDIPKVRRKLSTTSQEDDGQQNKECSIGISTDNNMSLQTSTLSTSGLSATPPTKQLDTTRSTSGLEASPSTLGLVASPSTSGQAATSSTSGLVASPSTSRQFVTPSKSGLVASPFISELAVSLSKSGLSTPPSTSGLAKTPSTSELTETTSEVANTSSTLEFTSSLASGKTASVTTPSRSSEGQNFMRQLNFQRPEDIIKAFRFGQEIQLQAMNKMMELMKKDKENYEQLEKELETEKASHVNAQQKLEQLETQFGSIMDCLHKKS
ncbi:protein PF3D7_1417600-like isoform X2 [Mytilus trossulus]|uniref:protein PF3D7_1417600-like isoform X2 n=1 Tax=Mytilus trossulus TaxID=6551 RepID=UPI0030073EB1